MFLALGRSYLTGPTRGQRHEPADERTTAANTIPLEDFLVAAVSRKQIVSTAARRVMHPLHTHRRLDLDHFELAAVKGMKRVRYPNDPPLDVSMGCC